MKVNSKPLFLALVTIAFAACSEKPVSPDTPYIIEGEVPNRKKSFMKRLENIRKIAAIL